MMHDLPPPPRPRRITSAEVYAALPIAPAPSLASALLASTILTSPDLSAIAGDVHRRTVQRRKIRLIRRWRARQHGATPALNEGWLYWEGSLP